MTLGPEFFSTEIFRETESVLFYDASFPNTNGCDVVKHGPAAVSPPDKNGHQQFYVHSEQVDRNLCVWGTRTFYLVNFQWPEPYHEIHLDDHSGAVVIPVGCFHRSVSGEKGSVLINLPQRSPFFDTKTEFIPVSVEDNERLREVVENVEPVVWKEGVRVSK